MWPHCRAVPSKPASCGAKLQRKPEGGAADALSVRKTFQNWFRKKQLTVSKASRIERHGGEGTRLKLHLRSTGAAPSPQQVQARPVFPGCYFDSSRWIIWLEKFLLLLPGPCLYFLFYFLFLRTSEFGWSWNVNQIPGLKKNPVRAIKEKQTNVPLMISGSYETRVIFNPLPVTISFTVRVCLQHNNHVHRVTFHGKKASRKVRRGKSHHLNVNWSVFVLLHGSRDIKSTWHQISRQRLDLH